MSNATNRPVSRPSPLRSRGRDRLPAVDGIASHVVHSTALGRSETRMTWFSPAPPRPDDGPE